MNPKAKTALGIGVILLMVIVIPLAVSGNGHAVVTATWVSLALGVSSSIIAVLLGAGVGFLGGYRGGRTETWLKNGYIDLLDSVPQFILLLVLVKGAHVLINDPNSLLNPISVALSISVANSTQVAALIMNKVKLIRENRYVKAAQLIGTPTREILLRKIAPFCVSELVVPFTHLVGWSIFIETAMSYMRFGVDRPFVSLGALLAQMDPIARPDERILMGAICVLTIGLTVALKVVGDGLHAFTHRRANPEAPPAP